MTDVEPDEESAAEALKRMCAERAIVEPVLVHIRDLWDDVDSAEPLGERKEIHQWHWAKRWNKARKALAEDLLMVQNDNHEMWLATIYPVVGDWTVDEVEKKRRGHAFREFRTNPSTQNFMKYMKDETAKLMFRCSVPGYRRRW